MHSTTTSELIDSIAADQERIARALAAQRLAPYLGLDVTLQQLRVILLVATGTCSTGSEIAEALHVSAPTVSASVDRLVELGYLARDSAGPDRRKVRLIAAAPAESLYEQFLGIRETSEELLASLENDDLEALARGTAALRRAIEHHPAIARPNVSV